MFIVSYSRIALGLLQVWIGLRIALAGELSLIQPTYIPYANCSIHLFTFETTIDQRHSQ